MGNNIGKNISENLNGKYSSGMFAMHQKLLDHSQQSTTDAFKTATKNDLMIRLVIKLLTQLHKFQEIHYKIIQKQLQMIMIKKYQRKDRIL